MGNELCSTAKEFPIDDVLRNTACHGHHATTPGWPCALRRYARCAGRRRARGCAGADGSRVWGCAARAGNKPRPAEPVPGKPPRGSQWVDGVGWVSCRQEMSKLLSQAMMAEHRPAPAARPPSSGGSFKGARVGVCSKTGSVLFEVHHDEHASDEDETDSRAWDPLSRQVRGGGDAMLSGRGGSPARGLPPAAGNPPAAAATALSSPHPHPCAPLRSPRRIRHSSSRVRLPEARPRPAHTRPP